MAPPQQVPWTNDATSLLIGNPAPYAAAPTPTPWRSEASGSPLEPSSFHTDQPPADADMADPTTGPPTAGTQRFDTHTARPQPYEPPATTKTTIIYQRPTPQLPDWLYTTYFRNMSLNKVQLSTDLAVFHGSSSTGDPGRNTQFTGDAWNFAEQLHAAEPRQALHPE